MSRDTPDKEFKKNLEQDYGFPQKLEEGEKKVNSSLVLLLWEDSLKEPNTNSDFNRALIHQHVKKIKEYTHQRLWEKRSNFKNIIQQITSPEEYEKFESLYKEVNEHVKTIIKKGSPYIRVKSENLFSILSEGFKTAFETNTSWWDLNLPQRDIIEKTLFWYESQKTDPICRPRYWYWYDENPFDCAEGYGDMVCKLKPSTIDNITILWCDTLYLDNILSLPYASFYDEDDLFFIFCDFIGIHLDVLEEIASNPSVSHLFQATFHEVIRNMNALQSLKSIKYYLETRKNSYMEIQHHGPLFAEDIESLHIPHNIELDQKVLHLCKQKWITIIKQ